MASLGGLHNREAAPHVLIFAVDAPGHIVPLLNLATELGRRGITITFVSTSDKIGEDGDESSAELQSLDARFISLHVKKDPHEGPGKVKKSERWKRLQDAFQPVLDKMVDDKRAGVAGPTSVLYDTFVNWAVETADTLQIPAYMFITSGIVFARLLQGLLPYFERGQFQISGRHEKIVPFDWPVCIPGLPPLSYDELPDGFHINPTEWRHRGELVGRSAGIWVNSFLELEEKVAETWRNVGNPGFEHIKVPKIYTIGPSISTSSPVQDIPAGQEDSASKCLHWLDSQPPSSVLYVAFGSAVRLSADQLHELALGLEDSKQRFVWVIRPPNSGEETHSIAKFLPPGFEARVGDHGRIVTGWAPQLQILAHKATGGFLTHCGWNSTLESVMFGVPMISWPQKAEQFLNSKFLVDDLKIAVRLETGPENILKRNEVERVVRLLLVEPEGKKMRSRVEEFQKKVAAALADGGSQSRCLQEFADDLRNHSPSPNPGRN